jgi:hypothetical protein
MPPLTKAPVGRIRKSKDLLVVSAITFLTLSIAFGAGPVLASDA